MRDRALLWLQRLTKVPVEIHSRPNPIELEVTARKNILRTQSVLPCAARMPAKPKPVKRDDIVVIVRKVDIQ